MITKEVPCLSEQKEKLPGWGGRNPILLPLSRNKEINVPQKYPRVLGDMMVTGGSGSMPVLGLWKC